MIPGKHYKPEDFLEILWRRKWLLIVPFVSISVAVLIGTRFLPNRYRADARIMIVPQRVPATYVRPAVTISLEERLSSIRQQILSRTWLERIIQEFDLYPEERRAGMIMEDVVQRMRESIFIIPERSRTKRDPPGSLTVSYESSNPRHAMLVTDRLASMLIKENMEDREILAEATNQFLQAQLDEARRRLIEHEKKLEAFRRANAGRLPSEVQSNLQVMQSTQMQLQALNDSVNRDRDRQLVVDRLIADMTAAAAATAAVEAPRPAARRTPTVAATAAEQLKSARESLQALELRLKPEHPDIVRAKRTIRDLEKKADAESLDQPLAGSGVIAAAPTSAAASVQKRLSELQAERESIERKLTVSKSTAERLQGLIAGYRSRVEAAPSKETELTELMRDYSTLQTSYTSLLTKSQESRIAVDLEQRQIGEQFRMLDSPRLPQVPTSPDRVRLNLMGAVAGLGLGLVLVALAAYRDTTLRAHDDVVTALALPVLALVPLIITTAERRAQRRRRLIVAASAAVCLTLSAGALVWRFGLPVWIP